ncbi:MAG: hypothetical protein LUI13_03525, partial [Lachnospiraceae bacterium]|nr:hypothetical protein [Lachnospiraceae bacterium]
KQENKKTRKQENKKTRKQENMRRRVCIALRFSLPEYFEKHSESESRDAKMEFILLFILSVSW